VKDIWQRILDRGRPVKTALGRTRSALRRRLGHAFRPEDLERRVEVLGEAPLRLSVSLWHGGREVARGEVVEGFLGLPGTWLAGALVPQRLRGRGLGACLARIRAEEAASRGHPKVRGSVADTNRRSRGALERAGLRHLPAPALEAHLAAHYRALGDDRVFLVYESAA
jgi:GNAT superfamily N-acetyltransferase